MNKQQMEEINQEREVIWSLLATFAYSMDQLAYLQSGRTTTMHRDMFKHMTADLPKVNSSKE